MTILFILILISTSFFISTNGGFLSESKLLNKTEKLSHFHFYFHDVMSGNNPTAVKIINPPNPKSSSGLFGETFVIDDALTEGRDPRSKIVGRAQGLYSISAQKNIALLMVMNFAFVEGKYNRSCVSILGRNSVFDDVRELPIVGGTGLFRFARGYALAHTVSFNPKTGDAIVEYNVYVLHY